MTTDVSELVEVAQRVAREAGHLIVADRPDRVTVAATKTSPQDVVTAMDLASEALLRRRLGELRPGDGVLGEERGLEPGSTGVTWVVDPIDGTVNYLYGLPAYAVSVAAVVAAPSAAPDRAPDRAPDPATWTVLAGCVHAPALGETFTAARGAGAFRNGVRLALGPGPATLGETLVGTGFGYRVERKQAQARVVAALLPQVRDVRRIGSAALDLCWVAAGLLDAYYERGLRPWDMAAGSLVVAEAGGVVAGLRGEPAGEAFSLAGAPGVVGRLAPLLEGLRADSEER